MKIEIYNKIFKKSVKFVISENFEKIEKKFRYTYFPNKFFSNNFAYHCTSLLISICKLLKPNISSKKT